jgi:hypothetical protein
VSSIPTVWVQRLCSAFVPFGNRMCPTEASWHIFVNMGSLVTGLLIISLDTLIHFLKSTYNEPQVYEQPKMFWNPEVKQVKVFFHLYNQIGCQRVSGKNKAIQSGLIRCVKMCGKICADKEERRLVSNSGDRGGIVEFRGFVLFLFSFEFFFFVLAEIH